MAKDRNDNDGGEAPPQNEYMSDDDMSDADMSDSGGEEGEEEGEPIISPEGMKLRSGRKKRRRSAGGSAKGPAPADFAAAAIGHSAKALKSATKAKAIPGKRKRLSVQFNDKSSSTDGEKKPAASTKRARREPNNSRNTPRDEEMEDAEVSEDDFSYNEKAAHQVFSPPADRSALDTAAGADQDLHAETSPLQSVSIRLPSKIPAPIVTSAVSGARSGSASTPNRGEEKKDEDKDNNKDNNKDKDMNKDKNEEENNNINNKKKVQALATSTAASGKRQMGRGGAHAWFAVFVLLHTLTALLSGGEVPTPIWSLRQSSLEHLRWYRSLLAAFRKGANPLDDHMSEYDILTAKDGSNGSQDVKVDQSEYFGQDFGEDVAEQEIIEKIVEEIVIEKIPDPDLMEADLKIRKQQLIDKANTEREAKDTSLSNMVRDSLAKKESEVDDLIKLIKESKDSFSGLVSEADGVFKVMSRKLDAWEMDLDDVERAVEELEAQIAQGRNNTTSEKKTYVIAALERLRTTSMIPLSLSLFDDEQLRIPGEQCVGEDFIPKDSDGVEVGDEGIDTSLNKPMTGDTDDFPLLMAKLQQAQDELIVLASSVAASVMEDEKIFSAVKLWVEMEIQASGLSFSSDEENFQIEESPKIDYVYDPQNGSISAQEATAATCSTPGDECRGGESSDLSLEDAHAIIARHIGVELVDGNGKYDYATISSGATVVRTGPRRTSPSLRDNLPLMNRILAAAKLRFYGHPPEAALVPTTPKSLGQCWAFDGSKALPIDADMALGKYGTLSVNLGDAVEIKSVVVEHVQRDLSPTPETAVRHFRVWGFDDLDGQGQPLELGAFQYDINNSLTTQEFEVDSSIANGRKMKSVTLAIDSNWGADYCCLYRFRVHGDRTLHTPKKIFQEESCTLLQTHQT